MSKVGQAEWTNTFPTIAVVRLKWGQVELFGSWQQTSSNGAKQVHALADAAAA